MKQQQQLNATQTSMIPLESLDKCPLQASCSNNYIFIIRNINMKMMAPNSLSR